MTNLSQYCESLAPYICLSNTAQIDPCDILGYYDSGNPEMALLNIAAPNLIAGMNWYSEYLLPPFQNKDSQWIGIGAIVYTSINGGVTKHEAFSADTKPLGIAVTSAKPDDYLRIVSFGTTCITVYRRENQDLQVGKYVSYDPENQAYIQSETYNNGVGSIVEVIDPFSGKVRVLVNKDLDCSFKAYGNYNTGFQTAPFVQIDQRSDGIGPFLKFSAGGTLNWINTNHQSRSVDTNSNPEEIRIMHDGVYEFVYYLQYTVGQLDLLGEEGFLPEWTNHIEIQLENTVSGVTDRFFASEPFYGEEESSLTGERKFYLTAGSKFKMNWNAEWWTLYDEDIGFGKAQIENAIIGIRKL